MQKWLNTFEVICPNPELEKEWIEWYKDIHAPDILETPGFLTARLYENKEYRDGRGKFLTTYEIGTDDIEETIKTRQRKRAKENAAGRGSTAFIPIWRDVVWRQIFKLSIDKDPIPGQEKWVNLVENNCVNPSKENEFNAWYNDIHLPDVLETPGFLSATRYEMKEYRDGRGKFFAIYEIASSNIEETMTVRREKRVEENRRGRNSNLWAPVWRDVLWRLVFELIK